MTFVGGMGEDCLEIVEGLWEDDGRMEDGGRIGWGVCEGLWEEFGRIGSGLWMDFGRILGRLWKGYGRIVGGWREDGGKIVGFTFRRFDFMLWHPITLFRPNPELSHYV